MNRQILKWAVDIGLLVSFVVCSVTGLLKWTLLMRMLGLSGIIFPLALFSDIHDWSGLVLIVLVCAHLLLNGKWIISVSKKVVAGRLGEVENG